MSNADTTPTTSAHAQSAPSELRTIKTDSIKDYLETVTDPLTEAARFDEIADICTQAAIKNDYKPDFISDLIFDMRRWRSLMILTAIESGQNLDKAKDCLKKDLSLD